jgi:glycosyltransferase involved in cell wall biosynthesis
MKISALTACRNAEATIVRNIASSLSQHYAQMEMIVVDGASADSTVAVAEGFGSPQVLVLSEPDRGMYAALNKGLALDVGDAVGVLYAADRVLSRAAAALDDHDANHGDLNFHDQLGRVYPGRRGTPLPPSGFEFGWMSVHPNFYARRYLADDDRILRAVNVHGARLRHTTHVIINMAVGGRIRASLAAHLRHTLKRLAERRRWLKSHVVDSALFTKPSSKITQFSGLRIHTR